MVRGPLRNCMGCMVPRTTETSHHRAQAPLLECDLVRFADRAIKIIQSAYKVLNNLENKGFQNNKIRGTAKQMVV